MPSLDPIPRRELVRKLKALGFEGPYGEVAVSSRVSRRLSFAVMPKKIITTWCAFCKEEGPRDTFVWMAHF